MKQRTLYKLIAAGGLLGLTASFLETIEYQILLRNAHAALTCNLNSVFSCSAVLNAWQSKLFGFPNSMLCMVFFTTMFATALVGAAGGTLTRTFRLWMHGIATFFLGFAMWFMWESTFSIRALCILCLFCLAGLFVVNWGWLRINAEDVPFGAAGRARVQRLIASGADIFAWLLLAIVVAFVMLLKFTAI